MQSFKDSQIIASVVEVHEWPHAVMKVDTDEYFDRSKFVWKLEGDGGVGFRRSRNVSVGTLAEFNLIEGKLDEEVRES